jgi:ABC-type uncharacterized transport system permease subunit
MVAVCIALLCIIGMGRTFLPAEAAKDLSGQSDPMGIDLVLLPYAAFGIAIMLVLLLLVLFDRRTHRNKLHKAAKGIARRAELPCGLRDGRER